MLFYLATIARYSAVSAILATAWLLVKLFTSKTVSDIVNNWQNVTLTSDDMHDVTWLRKVKLWSQYALNIRLYDTRIAVTERWTNWWHIRDGRTETSPRQAGFYRLTAINDTPLPLRLRKSSNDRLIFRCRWLLVSESRWLCRMEIITGFSALFSFTAWSTCTRQTCHCHSLWLWIDNNFIITRIVKTCVNESYECLNVFILTDWSPSNRVNRPTPTLSVLVFSGFFRDIFMSWLQVFPSWRRWPVSSFWSLDEAEPDEVKGLRLTVTVTVAYAVLIWQRGKSYHWIYC